MKQFRGGFRLLIIVPDISSYRETHVSVIMDRNLYQDLNTLIYMHHKL